MKRSGQWLLPPTLLLIAALISACGGGGSSGALGTGGAPPPKIIPTAPVQTVAPTSPPTQSPPSPQACISSPSLSSLIRRPAARTFGHNTAAYDQTHLEVYYRAHALSRAISKETAAFDGVTSENEIGPGFDGTTMHVVTVAPSRLRAAEEYFKNRPEVAAVSRVALRSLKTDNPIVPNDPQFNCTTQWDFFAIGMEHAWGYSTGNPGVQIAVIDTGFDPTHPELAGKVAFFETINKGNGSIDSNPASIVDTDGHGTNVSGIAADDTNNAAALAGVGFNVRLQEYKIFDSTGNASVADETKAISEAVAHGAKVINLSLGGSACPDSPDSAEAAAVANAISKGVVVVAAAGNEAPACTRLSYPAGYAGVIAVGASAINDSTPSHLVEYVASYSNYSASPTNALTLVAPGGDPSGNRDPDQLHWITNIYSKSAKAPACNSQPCEVLIAGTSQATPHVAGAAALLFSKTPAISPGQIKTLLQNTADNINAGVKQGAGRINVYRALAVDSGDPSPP